jgi:hypothetical protein
MNTNKLISVIKLLTVTIFLIYLQSCSQSRKENVSINKVDVRDDYAAVKQKEILEPKKDFDTESLQKEVLILKIIKSASVKYKVKDVKGSTKRINAIVEQLNGYISDLRFQNNSYQKANKFTIKIPQNKFNTIMDSIAQFAEFIDFENITSEDITEEYIDLQTRLNTKIEVKERYETILRKRAKTVKDILATEEKLRVIQEEIEATQGRLNYLTNKVSLSTIQVNLYETVTYKDEPESYTQTFFSKIKNGFSASWDIIEGILIGIVTIWPLILIAIGLFVFFRRRLRK